MNFPESIFDKRLFLRDLFIMLLMIPIQMATKGNGYVLVVPVAFFALVRNRSHSLMFWIMLSITLMMGNQLLMPKGPVFYICQRLLFIVLGLFALTKVGGHKLSPQTTPLLLLIPYLLYVIIPSIQGWVPMISILKLILFSVIFVAYFSLSNTFASEGAADMKKFRSAFLAFSVFFIVGSALLLPFPAIGQLTGAEFEEAMKSGKEVVSLFKGMTFHSQALGPVVAFIILLLFADMCFNIKKINKYYNILILLGFFIIYKTSSRAAMASALMGFMFVVWEVMRARGIGIHWRGKIISMSLAVIAVATVTAITVPGIRDGIARFAIKWGSSNVSAKDVTLENMTASRQSAMDKSLFYWRQKPMIGNGFQVSYEMRYRDTGNWTALISAPIEKGVWVTAVLEEGGVVGMALIVMFIVVAGFMMLRRKAYIGLGMLFTLFVSNMAEFTMFSMSAMGGFIWALIFIGSAFDALRIRDEQRGGVMPPMGMPPPMPYGMPPPGPYGVPPPIRIPYYGR